MDFFFGIVSFKADAFFFFRGNFSTANNGTERAGSVDDREGGDNKVDEEETADDEEEAQNDDAEVGSNVAAAPKDGPGGLEKRSAPACRPLATARA
jgi:hypothetical protein